MLVISDVHLGKVSHFRKFGSAVPQNAIAGNFQKMNEVIAFFDASKIVFLGDQGVGKTSIITRSMYDSFDKLYQVRDDYFLFFYTDIFRTPFNLLWTIYFFIVTTNSFFSLHV